MNRKYLPASIVVLLVGVVMVFLPQSIEMHIAPELVTVWEDTAVSENMMGEYVFQFNTGSLTIENSYPYIEVWSEDVVTLNTTFILMEDGTPTLTMNDTDNPAKFYFPGEDPIHVQILGTVIENQETTVHVGLYTLRPLPPEYITWYPYRFFGYGMAAIGAVASLIFYMRKPQDVNP